MNSYVNTNLPIRELSLNSSLMFGCRINNICNQLKIYMINETTSVFRKSRDICKTLLVQTLLKFCSQNQSLFLYYKISKKCSKFPNISLNENKIVATTRWHTIILILSFSVILIKLYHLFLVDLLIKCFKIFSFYTLLLHCSSIWSIFLINILTIYRFKGIF